VSPASGITEFYCRIAKGERARPEWINLFLLAVLAGMLISFAGAASIALGAFSPEPGIRRILSAAIFPAGVILAAVTGAEVFTGRILLLTPILAQLNSIRCTLRYWVVVWSGNLLGSIIIVLMMHAGGLFQYLSGRYSLFLIEAAANKAGYGILRLIVLGTACNILVCIGVLVAARCKRITDKALVIYFPIFLFVLLGFENSIANMYTLPAGLLAAADAGARQAAEAAGTPIGQLTIWNVLKNLAFVTFGNVLGGAFVSTIDHKTGGGPGFT
jgi:formate/nitrite transporter